MWSLRLDGLMRPVVVTLAIACLYFGYETWLTVTGAQKLTADELPGANAKAHYEIVVNFPPEAFHITRVQDIGRVIEVRATSIFAMDIRGNDARELARNYWIADIKPWKGL